MKGTAVRQAVFVVALAAVALTAPGASAEERILAYHSEIEVAGDGSMTVAESIRVRAEGDRIKRGIYRDFPTRYKDHLGNRYTVAFEVLGVTRDGAAEPFHLDDLSNGVRVYVGSKSTYLEPGEYEYQITYRTDHQLGFFDDFDELYWNVTGNGWDFAIDKASARVRLPAAVAENDLRIDGYTGYSGEQGANFNVTIDDYGHPVVATNRPLLPQQGLTVAIGFPKGLVAEPTQMQRANRLLSDNRGLFAALVAFALLLAYLYGAWRRFGRDPEPGPLFPHYEPPAGFSPAAARYIGRMGYDRKTFTAAVINLAVKGHLEIERYGSEYLLRHKDSDTELAHGEKALIDALFSEGTSLELDNKNHGVVGLAMAEHHKSLQDAYHKVYFHKNSLLLLPAAIATVALAIALARAQALTPSVVVLIVLMFVAQFVFYRLLKAPTASGRELLDQVDGFKMYLEVAEKDELALRNPPQKTPQLFESYLPFALALGVEQKWAEKFADVFATMRDGGADTYHPSWYHGDFDANQLGRFTENVGGSLNSAISSAATPPGSSSGGGGGGSSGGGGGGGGGGGW
jgi:uncharacterized membrane protein YgcG